MSTFAAAAATAAATLLLAHVATPEQAAFIGNQTGGAPGNRQPLRPHLPPRMMGRSRGGGGDAGAALLVLALLASCGTEPPETNRTAFASSATGNIEQAGTPAGQARLVPFRPMTSDAEVLQGDPDVAGQPFIIRIRELPGTIVPPHSHPVDEHVTIVSGTWHFGFGDSFDQARLTALPTGSYGYAPRGSTMFAYAPDGAVVQVHGVGPFHISWKHGSATLTEQPARFRFRRGDRVLSPLGEGIIRQGYASGPLVQYEIEGGANGLFMAQERDLRPTTPGN